jgi:diguanylate cyclase (GGDEF)-like protein/PAS domain S-box-containing protein
MAAMIKDNHMLTSLKTHERSLASLIEQPIGSMTLLLVSIILFATASEIVVAAERTQLAVQLSHQANLLEIRSLSRSLQRDTLAFVLEANLKERRVLVGKLKSRVAQMAGRTGVAERELMRTDPADGKAFGQLEREVITSLQDVWSSSMSAPANQTYDRFRRDVRPRERAVSAMSDQLIAREARRSERLNQQMRLLEIGRAAAILLLATIVSAVTVARLRRRLRREVLSPLQAVTEALRQLSRGNRQVAVDGAELDNEIGEIARAAEAYKINSSVVERLQAVIAATFDAVLVINQNSRIVYWNDAAEQTFGWNRSEIVGEFVKRIVPSSLQVDFGKHVADMAAVGDRVSFGTPVESSAVHRDGTIIPVEVAFGAWPEDDGVHIGAIIRDLTARRTAEADRQRTAEMMDAIVESMPLGLFVKDVVNQRFRLVNKALEDMVGLDRGDLLGKRSADLFSAEQVATFGNEDRRAIAQDELAVTEEMITRPDGAVRVLRIRKLGISRTNGDPTLLLGMSEDITESRQAQDRIHHMAHHDALTGLANRFHLNQYLSESVVNGPGGALISIDLDRFKAVNDLHGHPVGDQVLVEVASRLSAVMAPYFVARIGGDEFEVVIAGLTDPDKIRELADTAIAAISRPIRVAQHSIHIGASAGVTLFPQDAVTPEELMRAADLALYRAKSNGRGACRFYEPGMDALQREHREIEEELRRALQIGSIIAHYQPVVCLETGQIDGYEALARWTHPTRGSIPPDVFVPIAEASGLILELGRVMLEQAISDAMQWPSPLYVAVNLSPLQVQDGGIVDTVRALLARTGFSASRLELEITEGLLIHDTDKALETLNALKRLGVRIVMDDFGTGYSSLSYFRMFPFDKVKIDQSFVRDMASNRHSLAVVQAVIGLSRGLGLNIVAEGVETEQQLEALRNEGCGLVQGYLLGRPQPRDHLEHVTGNRSVSA